MVSIQGLVDDYEKICSVAEKMWQEKGDHALLHHLNALYGQVPITFSAVAHLMRL